MSQDERSLWDEDRDRGILTTADRKFLRGEKTYKTEQSERDARYRIRQRVKNSILDFNILLHHFGKKDRNHMFVSSFPEDSERSREDISFEEVGDMLKESRFKTAMSNAIAFFYLGALDVDWDFEELAAIGVENAEEELGYIIDEIEVDIEIKRSKPDVQELVKRLEEGETLSAEEIRTVIRSGEQEIDEKLLDTIFKLMSEELSDGVESGELDISYNGE